MIDPLPASPDPTLDRRSLVTMLLAALAGLTAGGAAGAIAPLPAETDCPTILRRIANHPDVEYVNETAASTRIDLPGLGLMYWHYDNEPEPHSLIIMNHGDASGDKLLTSATFAALLIAIADHLDDREDIRRAA